jgi:hypothetical protein
VGRRAQQLELTVTYQALEAAGLPCTLGLIRCGVLDGPQQVCLGWDAGDRRRPPEQKDQPFGSDATL